MWIDSTSITQSVSLETGVVFNEHHGADGGEQWIELHPKGHSKSNTFTIRTIIGWRHIEILFIPGAFSGDLLSIMSSPSSESKKIFITIFKFCKKKGAIVSIKINNQQFDLCDDSFWGIEWTNVQLSLRVGQLKLEQNNPIESQLIVKDWVVRLINALFTLIPMENNSKDFEGEAENYPEGTSVTVQVNRFERDPRNRAAALMIQGYKCLACGLLMSDIYGRVASSYIEVHHVVPVSEIGNNYMIDPEKDLVPLCPNCHSIAHRRNPPYSIKELKGMVSNNLAD